MGSYESLSQDVSNCDERGQSPENREEIMYDDFVASDDAPLGYDTSATSVFDSNLVTQSPRPKQARSERKRRLFTCNECGKSFKRKGAIQEHLVNVHTVDRPFVCSSCDLKFKRKRTLEGHIFCVHGLERPFRCVECGSTFKRKDHLQRHVMKIHCAAEPSSDTLRRRGGNVKWKPKFVKGGGEPFAENQNIFSCNLCQATFKRKSHFRTHVFQVHGEKELADDVQSMDTKELPTRHRLHRKAKSSSGGGESRDCTIDERKCDTSSEDYRSRSSPEDDGAQKSEGDPRENEIFNDPIHQNGLEMQSLSASAAISNDGLGQKKWKGTRDLDLPPVVEEEGTAFRCEVCGETFELRIKLGRHFKRKHSVSESRAKTDSILNSVRKRTYDGGKEVMKKPRKILIKKKTNFEVQRKSIVANRKQSQQKIACPSCLKSFKEYRELIQHARKCEKYVLFAKTEQKKRREVVLERREYGCSICGSTLLNVESMSAHLSQEHGTDFFFHMCKPCPCEDGTHFTICH